MIFKGDIISPGNTEKKKGLRIFMAEISHNDSEANGKLLYTTEEAAKVLGVNVRTLANWRSSKEKMGPKFVRVSPDSKRSKVLYRYDDLKDWADSLQCGWE